MGRYPDSTIDLMDAPFTVDTATYLEKDRTHHFMEKAQNTLRWEPLARWWIVEKWKQSW